MAYVYQEYPKWVHPEGKPPLIVRDADEEATAMGGDPVVREADERKRLLAVAEVKGVKVDRRWSLDNLKAAIIGAGFDPTLDPFK